MVDFLGPYKKVARNSAASKEYIVTLNENAPPENFLDYIKEISGRLDGFIYGAGNISAANDTLALTISVQTFMDDEHVLNFVRNHADVQFAEANSEVTVSLSSTDALYSDGHLWGMSSHSDGAQDLYKTPFGARADVAWANAQVAKDGHIGAMSTVVGVIDTGIDPLHPDLYLNIWINQNEIPKITTTDADGDGIITFRDLNALSSDGSYLNPVKDINDNGYIDADDILRDPIWADGIDTDQNGFVDDFFGWDFLDRDNRPFEAYLGYDGLTWGNPSNSYHGTHVAGTIGAMANDSGVVGVSWDVQLMPLRFISEEGIGAISNAIAAINYYTLLGASHTELDFVATNNSWDINSSSQALSNAIKAAGDQGHLFISAAGNLGQDNDIIGNFPSNFSVSSVYNGVTYDPIISVAAIDSNGNLTAFSNYGAQSVDLAAPGQNIISTFAGKEAFGRYAYVPLEGTSMAAPHVTGALALLAGEFPSLSPDQLRAQLLSATAPTASLEGKTVSGGRLDVGAIIRANTAPVASDDIATAITELPIAIDVLANDVHSEQAALSLTELAAASGGTVSVNEDGTIYYKSAPGFVGIETFSYMVSDNNGDWDDAVVSVQVMPQSLPESDQLQVLEGATFGTYDLNVLDNDGAISVAAVLGSAGNIGKVVAGMNGGLFIIFPDGSLDFSANGEFETLGAGDIATTSVTYTPLLDPIILAGLSAVTLTHDAESKELLSPLTEHVTITVTVTGENDAPVVTGESFQMVQGGALSSINVLANDHDIDGDVLRIVKAAAEHGTVVINANDTLTYTPSLGYLGQDIITYAVSDGHAPAVVGNALVEITEQVSGADPKHGVVIGVKAFTPSAILPEQGTFIATAPMSGALSDGHIVLVDHQDGTLSDDNAGYELAFSSGEVDGVHWSNISTDNEAQWLVQDAQGNQVTIFQIEVEDAVERFYWGATGELKQGVEYTVLSRNTNPDAQEGVDYADMLGFTLASPNQDHTILVDYSDSLVHHAHHLIGQSRADHDIASHDWMTF